METGVWNETEQAVTELVKVPALKYTRNTITAEMQYYYLYYIVYNDDLVSTGFLKKTLHGICNKEQPVNKLLQYW